MEWKEKAPVQPKDSEKNGHAVMVPNEEGRWKHSKYKERPCFLSWRKAVDGFSSGNPHRQEEQNL